MRRIILIVLLAGALAAAAASGTSIARRIAAAARFPAESEAAVTQFAANAEPGARRLPGAGRLPGRKVFSRTPRRAMPAREYPGLPAGGARKADGVRRLQPHRAAARGVARARTGTKLTLPSGRDSRRGTDPASRACWPAPIPRHADYWGDITDRDQRIAEAADVALALWLSRATVWEKLGRRAAPADRRWLLQVNGKKIADNNWHLFVRAGQRGAASAGREYDAAAIEQHLARTLEFYRGDGWFTDGPDGPVDYYNAWGFYYHIGWIHRMNAAFARESVDDALPVFAADLLHLLGPNGMPVFGRSVCYRMAVSAPLDLRQHLSSGVDARPRRRGARST